VIYFGADRFANAGDAALGFWFFKNDVGLAENGKFSGEHAIGDVLVQVDFVQGGTNSQVQIFQWVGGVTSARSGNQVRRGQRRGGAMTTPRAAHQQAPSSRHGRTPKSGRQHVPGRSSSRPVSTSPRWSDSHFSFWQDRSSHSETAELKGSPLAISMCSVDVEGLPRSIGQPAV
jgi:hypothetical protein